jgi:outer membrane protein assembly factor BamB
MTGYSGAMERHDVAANPPQINCAMMSRSDSGPRLSKVQNGNAASHGVDEPGPGSHNALMRRPPSPRSLRLRHLALLLCSTLAAANADHEWPQYRGPQASGLNADAEAPVTWNVADGSNVKWQTPIPGLAHSCPIVWNDRIYVTTAVKPTESELKVGLYGDIAPVVEKEPHQWRLLALDRNTGKVLWNTLALEAVPRVQRHPKASHNNSTPATDGQRIVAIMGSEGLFCFNADGTLAWKKDLGPMDSGFFMVPTAQWGFASSPVIHDGKVIVLVDVQKDSFLAAYDLKDGTELWRTPRKDVPTWGTPTVIASPDRKQIVVNGWHHSGGYDFATGKELWKLTGGGDIPVPTPIAGHGFVYLTSAHGRFRPMRAIRLDAEGDITPKDPGATNAAIAWAHARQGSYMQTPILVGNALFGCTDGGLLTRFDAKTGAIQYGERLSKSGEGFTASPVSDGKHVYFTSEQGKVFVVPAEGPFSVAATNELGETCMATPALVSGTLYFRTRTKLMAIGPNETRK